MRINNKFIWRLFHCCIVILLIQSGCSNDKSDGSKKSRKAEELDIPEGRLVVRSLTDEDMKIPGFRYQTGVNMERNRQVSYPSPKEKPEIQWIKNMLNGDTKHVFVDTDSCTWFATGDAPLDIRILVRLDPDGSEILKKKIVTDPIKLRSTYRALLQPVLMCEQAVICFYQNRSYDQLLSNEPYPVSVWCFDFDGNIIWQSEIFYSHSLDFETKVYRIPENRILVHSLLETDYMQILKLSYGEILERFELSDFYPVVYTFGPLYMKDGGYITYRERKDELYSIARFASDYSVDWEFDVDVINSYTSFQPPILTPDGKLIISDRTHMAAHNPDSGQVIWEHREHGRYQVSGVDQDGNILCFTAKDQRYRLHKINPNGTILNSVVVSQPDFSPRGNFIIYEDGNYLFGHMYGLTLADDEGPIWTISKEDFGQTSDSNIYLWNLNPTPDGRIIVNFWSSGYEPFYETEIYSLGSKQ